jgi:hypothetical protein
MVKLSLACLALASAVNTEAPVISLDLSQTRHPYKLTKRIEHLNAKSGLAHGRNVTSYQDYSVRCAAGASSSETASCPSPTASAYDHHDKEVVVTTKLYLVNQRLNQSSTSLDDVDLPKLIADNVIDYSKRATYLFKYDATDESGNDAQQVVFALILDDLEAPTIQYSSTDESNPVLAHEQIIEASSDWKLDTDHCDVHAQDNIDGNVSPTLLYKVEKLWRDGDNNVFRPMWTEHQDCCDALGNNCQNGGGNADCYQAMGAAANIINTSAVCNTCKDGGSAYCHTPACVYRVTIKANDYAGIYGHDGKNNQRTHAVTLEVRDTRKPVIHVLGKSPKAVECHSTNKYQELFSDGVYRQSGNNGDAQQATDNCNDNNGDDDWCGAGAHVRDLLETEIQKKTINYTVASNVDLAEANANYTVTFSAQDESGNMAEDATRKVMVIDTTKPTLSIDKTMTGTNAKKTGIVYMYTEMAHSCDAHNQTCRADQQYTRHNAQTDGGKWSDLVQTSSTLCQDECSNDGNTTVTYRWSMVNTTEDRAGFASEAHRSGIVDGHLSGVTPWHTGPGTYVQTFTCTDGHGNTDEAARTYIVEDNEDPMITLNAPMTGTDKESVTVEASREAEYTDSGAKCTDFSDGQIDHQVVISGDVVNMRVPGTYSIHFDCEDSSGNDAATVTRTVVVKDRTCPLLTLHGQNTTSVEAGFPYEDVGATATDTLDGDLTAHITTYSGSLSSSHFLTMKSCNEIFTQTEHRRQPKPPNGMYNIVTQPTGKDHRHQVVYCDFDAASATTEALTMFIAKTEVQITPYKANLIGVPASDKCTDYGLKMADEAYVVANVVALKKYAHNIDGGNCHECVFPGGADWPPSTSGVVTTDYFCKENAATTDLQKADEHYNNHYKYNTTQHHDRKRGITDKTADISNHDTLSAATDTQIANGESITRDILRNSLTHSGKFTIDFFVKDYAGNGCSQADGNCDGGTVTCSNSQAKRTVVVVDTLPPVITLTLRDKLIQTSDASKLGVGGEYNPAGRKTVVAAQYSTHYHNSPFREHKNVVVQGNPFLDANTNTSVHQYGVTADDHNTAHRRRGNYGLMAEQTANNGWLIAAAASAVAGVALMGYSMKTAPVTVPV